MPRPLTRIESVIQTIRTRISARVDGPAPACLRYVRRQRPWSFSLHRGRGLRAPGTEGLISALGLTSVAAPLALAEMEPRLDRAVDPLCITTIAGNARGRSQARVRLDAQ